MGLGNPGRKYEGTRHNAGFAALDHAAAAWGIEVNKAKFDALTGTGTVAGHKVLLMKPQTFMNASGAVSYTHLDVYKRQGPDTAAGRKGQAHGELQPGGPFRDGLG